MSLLGSRSEETIWSSLRASAIISAVRLRTKTGFPRHFTMKFWPYSIWLKSTSITPAAKTSFDGHHV